MCKRCGYTLVEMMSVLVIVAVLLTMAVVSYERYLIGAHRQGVKVGLSEVASALSMVTLRQLGGEISELVEHPVLVNVLQQVNKQYASYEIEVQLTEIGYFVVARPKVGGRQAGDGLLWLDHLGLGCWFESVDNPQPWQVCAADQSW